MNAFPSAASRRNFPRCVILRRSLLVSAIAVSGMTFGAQAGVVPVDGWHAVFPGHAVEEWQVREGGTLRVARNAQTLAISSERGSLVMLNGARVEGGTAIAGIHAVDSTVDIRNSDINGGTLAGVGTGATFDAFQPSSIVTASDSRITGVESGITAAGGGSISIARTQVNGTGNNSYPIDDPRGGGIGAYVEAGSITIADRSQVRGERTGALLNLSTGGGRTNGGSTLLVDNSLVEGRTGSAILVAQTTEAMTSDITIQNNAELIGGNGRVLEVTGGATANFNVLGSTLRGDIVNDTTSVANVNLSNNANIIGVFTNVSAATLASGGTWQLTGASDVGTLTLNSGGAVALGDGNGFNTLTVTGDYTGSGGTLLFNTVLGDDASASDKLIVNGSTSGQTNVAVNNVGGAGAQTINGIQLIQVDGASNGEFNLAGRAVGGQYEYFLFKGGKADPNDGDWYLRSELPGGPNPCLADPNSPDCLVTLPEQCKLDPNLPQCMPVLRPEPGAYLANQAAATGMFTIALHDRTGGTTRGQSERGVWARVSRSQADYGVIGDQLSVNGDTDVLQLGTDVFTWGEGARGQLGVMLGSGRANNTVTSRLTGYSARGKVEGQSIGVYGSWLQDPAQTTGLYLDGWVQYAQFRNTVQGDALARERYDSNATSASVEAGYGFQVLDSARTALFVEPQLQLTHTDFSADRHVERNGTVIDGSDAGGLISRVGVRLFGHANSAVGNRVQPFAALNWIHGTDDNRLRFDGERMQGGVPQDRYEAKAGAALQLGQRWTAWGDIGVQKGQGGYRNVAGQIGLRATW